MKLDDDKRQKALAVRPDATAYEVGYGKPPSATRFKAGKTGNPIRANSFVWFWQMCGGP